ncbi:MAG: hypothetical protein HC944_04560 [Nanoarchaeota archaeon]|nr:hypothetical protein [Nanoarchaeota archaeon]
MSKYLNPGKSPEPFDFTIDTLTGDGTTLHRIKYTNCDAIDLVWYLQDSTLIYQFSGNLQSEIREKYLFTVKELESVFLNGNFVILGKPYFV